MKNRRFWILLGGVAVLSAAFLLLNFRVAMSSTQAEHTIVTTTSGDRLPDALQDQGKITVVVVGEGPLVSTLQKAVPTEMSKAGIKGVELAQETAALYENPVLLINVGKPGVLWTPFFATSQFPVEAGYASNGDTTFMSESPIVYSSADGPTVNMAADYKITDRSWGILSYSGYHQVLADWLAKSIAEATQKLYQDGTP